MDEISTSFCFICLLHLANEQGLKLESTADGEMKYPGEGDVGNIWDLKVRISGARLITSLTIFRPLRCIEIRVLPSRRNQDYFILFYLYLSYIVPVSH